VRSNPCVTSYSSSLMIFDSLRAVLAVECNCRMVQQFVDDFSIPRGCSGCRIHPSRVTAFR